MKNIDDVAGVIVPKHLLVLQEKFADLMAEMRDAFVLRPIPIGEEVSDLYGFIEDILTQLEEAAQSSIDALIRLNGEILLPNVEKSENVTIIRFERLAEAVGQLLQVYNDVWRHPFACEIAGAQPLLAGVVEKVMLQFLRLFEQLSSVVLSARKGELPSGNFVELKMEVEIEREVALLDDWLVRNNFKRQRTVMTKSKHLFFAGVLGWLFGSMAGG